MRNNKQRIINCKDCGVSVVTTSNRMLRCKSCAGSQHYNFRKLEYKFRIKRLMQMALNRANTKKVDFDLTLDFLTELWEKNNGRCSVSDREFDLDSSGVFARVNQNAPSLDRIIPEKGYTQGNVRFVTYHVNVALAEFGEEKLRILCKDILNQTNKT
jgi:hypothetical protein